MPQTSSAPFSHEVCTAPCSAGPSAQCVSERVSSESAGSGTETQLAIEMDVKTDAHNARSE